MTLPTERQVDNFLKARVNGLGLGYAIAWPGINFTAPAGAPYLAADIMRQPRRDRTLRGTIPTYEGRLNVSVVWPEGAGEGPATDAASAIVAAFPAHRQETIGTGRIVFRPAHIPGGYPDGARWRIPVGIPFTVYP